MVIFDQVDSVGAADQEVIRTFAVQGSDAGGLKVTLAWTDYPGDPSTGIVLVNDLDLIVYAPDGSVYLGNFLGRTVWGTASTDWSGTNSHHSSRARKIRFSSPICTAPGASSDGRHVSSTRQLSLCP